MEKYCSDCIYFDENLCIKDRDKIQVVTYLTDACPYFSPTQEWEDALCDEESGPDTNYPRRRQTW